jgi:hypothetical protein
MKIYNKKDFLKLPPGSFFAKGIKWVMDGFCIKGDTISDCDFYYLNLVNIDAFNTEQLFDRYEEMLTNGISYPINEDGERDGTNNDEEIFLVFERKDLEVIVKSIVANLR